MLLSWIIYSHFQKDAEESFFDFMHQGTLLREPWHAQASAGPWPSVLFRRTEGLPPFVVTFTGKMDTFTSLRRCGS